MIIKCHILTADFSASVTFGIFSLPISGYFVRKIDYGSKNDIKKSIRIMRWCNVLSVVFLLSMLSPCDDNSFLYAGGNIDYNDTGLESSWIPTESKGSETSFRLHKYNEP